MENQLPRLRPGVRVRCPQCRRFHPAIKPYAEGTDYTRLMLFVECRGLRYYVGQLDAPSPARQVDAIRIRPYTVNATCPPTADPVLDAVAAGAEQVYSRLELTGGTPRDSLNQTASRGFF